MDFICKLSGRFLPWLCTGLLACLPLTSAAAIQLTNADGSTIELDRPAKSLVTLSPHLAELVFAAGAGDLLVGTVEFSEYPPEASKVTRVGDAFRLDIEAIIAKRPDLVIAWDSGTPRAAVEQLRRLGLAVWSVEIREPPEIAVALRVLGRASGHELIAQTAAEELDRRLGRLSEQFSGESPVTYFYQVDDRPLFTINGDHLISKGLALCGGRNIFENEDGLAFQVAHEAVISANPQIMLAPGIDGAADSLAAWREWPSLRAVSTGALFLLPADKISRATPRWFDALETACKLLHGSRRRQSG